MKKQEEEALDLEGLITELEQKLERLKVIYEQYFMGIEKREPLVLRKDVVRIMRSLDQIKIRNTGLRFRHRMIIQRFNSYRTYWSRTLRAIEQGIYHRDIARVSRKMARQGISMPSMGRLRSAGDVERAITSAFDQSRSQNQEEENQRASTESVSGSELSANSLATSDTLSEPNLNADRNRTERPRSDASEFLEAININQLEEPPALESSLPRVPGSSERSVSTASGAASARIRPLHAPPLRTPGPPQQSPSARPFPSLDPLSEEQMKSLYRRFIKAKKICGEDISSVHYETLAKSLSQQLPKIQAQHQGRKVEFQVVIRAGRAIIRAQGKE